MGDLWPKSIIFTSSWRQRSRGFLDHLGPSFQDWWSAAGHVELDTDTGSSLNGSIRALMKMNAVL